MSYAQLIQAYFERSTALQWYWTVYIFVIGGVLGFSTFRQRPDMVTVILVTILYACFAYKNMGAIEETALERQAILSAIKDYPISNLNEAEIKAVRDKLQAVMLPYDIQGARNFHLMCSLLTLMAVWAKEWQRRKQAAVETRPA
jgi:hypothetical protein